MLAHGDTCLCLIINENPKNDLILFIDVTGVIKCAKHLKKPKSAVTENKENDTLLNSILLGSGMLVIYSILLETLTTFLHQT